MYRRWKNCLRAGLRAIRWARRPLEGANRSAWLDHTSWLWRMLSTPYFSMRQCEGQAPARALSIAMRWKASTDRNRRGLGLRLAHSHLNQNASCALQYAGQCRSGGFPCRQLIVCLCPHVHAGKDLTLATPLMNWDATHVRVYRCGDCGHETRVTIWGKDVCDA
jgi:hypothetical protein